MRRVNASVFVSTVIAASFSSGCYVLGGAGYENRASLRGAGGGMVEMRAGLGTTAAGTGPDMGLRGEVGTQGSKVGAGLGYLIAAGPVVGDSWFGFVRPEGWVMPLRWADAEKDSWVHPALSLGVLHLSGSSKGHLLLAGVRAEYLFRDDGFGRSLGWGLFLAYGEVLGAPPPPLPKAE